MRVFSLALVLLLCGAYSSVVSRALDSTVIIYADFLDDAGTMEYGAPICSGFVVKSDRAAEVIVTAAHCTDDIADRGVQFFDGDRGRVEGVFPSTVADVAVLYVQSRRYHRAVKTTTSVNPGDPLFIIGMPSGNPWSYTSARSRNGSQVFWIDNMPYLAIESAAAWHGDSGAGVFDVRGNVIGVLDGGGDSNWPAVVWITPIHYANVLF